MVAQPPLQRGSAETFVLQECFQRSRCWRSGMVAQHWQPKNRGDGEREGRLFHGFFSPIRNADAIWMPTAADTDRHRRLQRRLPAGAIFLAFREPGGLVARSPRRGAKYESEIVPGVFGAAQDSRRSP